MQEGRGLGGKKVNRTNLSLSNEYEQKLAVLTTAWNLKYPGKLGRLFLEFCLDNAEIVDLFQKEYCTRTAYKVRLIKNYETGKIHYVLNNKEREDI